VNVQRTATQIPSSGGAAMRTWPSGAAHTSQAFPWAGATTPQRPHTST